MSIYYFVRSKCILKVIAGTLTTLTATIQQTNPVSITLKTTNRLCFTDHTAVQRNVQIPANAFYTPVGLAIAIFFSHLFLILYVHIMQQHNFLHLQKEHPLFYLQF